MNYKQIKRKFVVGKIRARQIFLMLLALIVIFAGVPYSLHLVSKWNEIVPGGDWLRLDENGLYQEKIGNTQAKIGIQGRNPNVIYGALNDTVWHTGDEQDQIIISNPGSGTYGYVYWFLNYTVSDLINNDITKLKFNLTFPKGDAYDIYFGFYKTVYSNGMWNIEKIDFEWSVDDIWTDAEELTYIERSNATGQINWTITELMMIRAEHGSTIRPFLWLKNWGGDLDDIAVVSFSIEIENPPDIGVKSITVLQIGALVIGIILVLMGVASTGYWNPLPGSKKGPIDKWILKVTGKVRKK